MGLKVVILTLLAFALYAAGRHQQRLKLLRDTVNYQNVQESYFRINQKYKFKYNGQVKIGVPDHSNQNSMTRFTAEVTLVKRSEEHFIIRVNNIRLGKQLGNSKDQDEMASFEELEPVEIKQSDLKILELPVEFTYAEGQVQDLVFQQDDEEWSENLKRGIINLFQIKLQSTDRTSMEEEQSALNRIDTESKTNVGTAYRTREKTVEGECDTMYTVSAIDDDDDDNSERGSRMLVTKAIDMKSCQRRPEVWWNFQFISPCPRCHQLPRSGERSVESSTTIRYQIRGKRDKFLIERVELSNDHVIAQQNADESAVVVKIKASLKLVSSQESNDGSSEMSNFPATGQRVSDLIYSTRDDEHFDRFYAEGDQHYNDRLFSRRQKGQDKSAALAEIIMKMMRHMKDTADEKANRYFYKAVQLMRYMSESEIRSTNEHHFGRQQSGMLTPEERERARNIMPNLLAQAGTLSSFRQLADKIANGEINPLKAAIVITTMMDTPRVSKEIITELMRLDESQTVQRNEQLRRAILLTAGSMMRTMCAPQRHQRQQRQESQNRDDIRTDNSNHQRCDSEIKQRFVRTIADRLAASDRWEDQVILIRALGNAGLDVSISELESIIRNQDRRNPAAIRLEAILALRHIKDSLPQKTKNILLSAAANRMESSAVRMAAIQMLLQQNPDRMTIDQIGVIINHDPNRRVASFAYKLIRRLADSNQPCYEENKQKLQTVAKSVRRRNLQLPHSDMIFESVYDREKKTGFDFFIMPMYDMDDIVPKFMRAGINMVERGERNRNLFALEIGTSSLSNIISELLPDIEQNQRGGNTEIKMKLRRMAEETRRNGNRGSRQQQQQRQQQQRQTKAWMSMKFRNQDIMLLTFNEDRLKQLTQQNRGAESLLLLIAKMASNRQGSISIDEATLLRETVVKIPTAIGSQLSIRRKAPAIFSAHGQASIGRNIPIQADIRARISTTISMVTDVSSRTPISTNGIYLIKNIKATVPVDMTISLDHRQEDEQLKIQMRNHEGYKDLLKLESRPVIYYMRSQNPLAEAEEKTVVAEKNVRMESFKRCMRGPLFGSEICMRGVITTPMCNHNKLLHYMAPWFGPNKVTISAYMRRTEENENENENSRQVGLTIRSDSMQNKLELEYETSSRSLIPTKVDAKLQRQGHDGQRQEICINMKTQGKENDQRSEQTRRSSDININWGTQCNDENYIKARIETASRRNVIWEQRQSNAIQEDNEERDQKQIGYGVSSEETAGYKIQIQHRNVPEWAVDKAEDIIRMLTSMNYWSTEIENKRQRYDSAERNRQRDEQSRAGEVRIQAIMRNEDKADVKIQTPRKTIRMNNVYIPTLLRKETYRRSNFMRLMNLYMGNKHAKGTCQIRQNSITTFDGAIYRIPFSSCYTILARDSEEDPKFAIMARRSREQPDKKVVKLMTSDHEIELIPERGGGIEVKVDGQRWDDQQSKHHRAMRIRKRENEVTVDLKRPNVDVHYDGNEITIRVSDKYHGRQTGMCGNLNADSSDEFSKSNQKNRDDIWETFNEMTIRTDDCQHPQRQEQDDSQQFDSYDSDSDSNSYDSWEMARQHRSDDSISYDDEEESSMFDSDQQQQQRRDQERNQHYRSLAIDDVLTETAPVRRNKVIDSRGRKCISMRPIESCPEHGYTARGEKEEKEVPYTCLKANDELYHKIGRMQRQGTPMDLSNSEMSFTRKETVPRKCISIV
ncbi:Vitellogenin N and VWD and DUF1943 domain contain ing protein [Trichuris trichiura]|uniref:Vitellogenin N and VWD and DUF1943 domain contain ing protein n=1 Tax=Trichuris trichiura TaxID=36087 RepID=A0A077ZE83_TRITR|nr:Vitellogenin N and VWD and DUF1943 domain contain ing protein [Trichuris trichiura]